MKSIKDLVPAAVEMYGEEMSKCREYRELNNVLMDKMSDFGEKISPEASNALFDAHVALIGYVERYFYGKGLRDGAALREFVAGAAEDAHNQKTGANCNEDS